MPRARIRLLATAVATGALTALLAMALVDNGFRARQIWPDLDHPRRLVSEPEEVGPSPLGLFQWSGAGSLSLRLGPLERGDRLILKLRTTKGEVPVALLLDGHRLTTLDVDDSWRSFLEVLPTAGTTLALRQEGLLPTPVHVSRITVSNIRGAFEGPAPIYFTDPLGHAHPPAPVVAGVAAVAGLLLLAWGLIGRRGYRRALVALLPGLIALAALAISEVAGGPQAHVSTAAFLLLLLLPSAIILATRGVKAAVAMTRRSVGSWMARQPEGSPHWLTTPLLGPDETRPPTPRRKLLRQPLLLHLTATTLGMLLVGGVIVQDVHGPAVWHGDLNQWTFQAAYVARNLTLWPVPHLDLVNDQLFYPYGGDNVYEPWALEMHLFTSGAPHVLGQAGWWQVYFLLSLAITAVLGFLLLAPDFGPRRASVASLAVAFGNFYVLGKYPGHLGVACVHWTTLNILADAVIVRRVVRRQPLTARLLAVRALLLVLALGQDLSYVAGVALTCFAVSTVYVAALVLTRARFAPRGVAVWLQEQAGTLRTTLRAHPWQVTALAVATLVVAWLWIPLVLDIRSAAALYDFNGVRSGVWWANPLRMLAPVLPGVPRLLERVLRDAPEGAFAANPGLFLVLPAVIAAVAGRRRWWLESAPFIAVLALFLSFHPQNFPLLKALPWFAFARVTGRLSVAYPALLATLALGISGELLRRRLTRLGAVLLAMLAVAEVATAYSARAWPKQFIVPDAAMRQFFATVRRAPGEAVLDWPFCLVGGNGVGNDSTGWFYARLAGASVLQAFHGKKIVGNYFGRLHPDQLKPYLEAGWNRMFMPDVPNNHRAKRQRRDFNAAQWQFMEEFLRRNDFCGVILYTDLLPPATVRGFHERVGEPTARYDGFTWGPMEFIPKPPAWRRDEDGARGRSVKLADFTVPFKLGSKVRPVDGSATDYLASGWHDDHTEGHMAELRFGLDRIERLALTLKLAGFGAQHVDLALNGAPLATFELDGPPRIVSVWLPADKLRHDNTVRLDLPDACSPQSRGISNDPRLLGVTLEWLRIARHPASVLQLGERLPAGPARAEDHLRSGWSQGGDVRTTVGPSAELLFGLARVRPLVLVMNATTLGEQRVVVELNGITVATLHGLGDRFHEVTVPLPEDALRIDNRVVLHLPDARSPKTLGRGDDTRPIGLRLRWLELRPSPGP